MRLGKYLSSLTKPELEELKEKLNLTEDEEAVFCLLARGKSNLMTADKCGISASTLDNRVKAINAKLQRLEALKCQTN